MTEVLTEQLTFGRYHYGYGTEGSNVRKLVWINDYAYPDYALALDFRHNSYWSGGVQAASLAAMSGYSYTRSGTVSFVNSASNVETFLANAPPILSNIGYEAYAAATNLALRSQEFDNASWNKTNISIAANAVTAPDGTLTADTATISLAGAHNLRQTITVTAGTAYTFSFFAKRGTATAMNYRVYDVTHSAEIVAPTDYYPQTNDSWVRVTVTFTTPVGCVSIFIYTLADGASTGTVNLWQAQLLAGTFADGGPIIATAGATASIGANILTVTDTIGAGADQLFILKGTTINSVYATFSQWSDGTSTNTVEVSCDTGALAAYITAAGVFIVIPTLAYSMSSLVTIVVRRLGGNWRLGKVVAGVLTWSGIDVAGAFPTAMTRLDVGNNLTPPASLNNPEQFVGRKLGTFSTDASVLAAVSAL